MRAANAARPAWLAIMLGASLAGVPGAVQARPRAADARPRAIEVDVRGPAEEATALRATLEELVARRGLPLVFQPLDGDRASPSREVPWATLSFDLGGADSKGSASGASGPALTLREGAGGRLRLHRVVPANASRAVTIEALATIAYTALETLAREETAGPGERSAARPRERAESEEQAPALDLRGRSSAEHDIALDRPAGASAAPVSMPAAQETTEVAPVPESSASPETSAPTDAQSSTLTVSSRASPAAPGDGGAASFPVRFSVTSFAGYEAGNVVTGDRRVAGGAWGMGVGVTGAIARWPLEPALGVALGAWHGTVQDDTDGAARPVAVPQLQGHAELRLTVARVGRFSAALGPWLTVTRAGYDSGPTGPMPSRGPEPTEGSSPDPNAPPGAGPSRVTHTELSGGLVARVEAALGDRLAMYLALAGTTPLTDRSVAGGGRPGPPTSPTGSGEIPAEDTGTRLTLSAFAGLSIALTGEARRF